MAHRIEIELTSQTDDSTWTWRAAGAKQPRGTVDAGLVPAGTATGTVLRAEVETTLDGTTVLALLPKGKSAPRKVETIEVVGNPSSGPDVNVVLASKSKGRRRDDRTEGSRAEGSRDGSRRPADRRPRSESGERGGRRDTPARTGGGEGPASDRRR